MSKLGELERRLAGLRAKTEAGFGRRAAELRAAADRLGAGDPGARADIKRLAHKLRGIAGSAGHPTLTERAGRLESAITADASTLAVVEGAKRLASATEKAGLKRGGEAPSAAKPTSPGRTALGWRVVALDDESATRRLLEITLRSAGGCEANVLEHPADAMRAILEAPTDLVIVDAMMPEMNGLEFYEGVRSRCGGALPVVILSAASPGELGWPVPDDPRLTWMRKPFRPANLIADLRVFVERGATT